MREAHPLVKRYVEEVCGQIKAKEARADIREEIASHLEDLIESRRAEGAEDDAAALWAIGRMGDASSVAEGLNRVHKPRTPWAMLGALAMLAAIALLAMYAVELSYAAGRQRLSGVFERHTAYMGAGFLVLWSLSRLPYTILLRLSRLSYGATVALLMSVLLWGERINGAAGYIFLGPIRIDVVEASLYLFLVSSAGALYRRRDTWGAVALHLVAYSVVPLALYALLPSYSSAVLYAAANILFLSLSRCGWRWIVPHAASVAAAGVLYLLMSRHGLDRLRAFLHRYSVPDDAGYMYIQIDRAIRSAGWRGHGFGSVNTNLPYIHSDTIFTYLVYSLGWFVGVFVFVSAVLFVSQLVKAAGSVREPYGKMLINGIVSLFAVQFAWSFGMSLGLLPIVAMTVPFLGYGGGGLLAQLAAIGLVYGVYRRKDLIRPMRR